MNLKFEHVPSADEEEVSSDESVSSGDESDEDTENQTPRTPKGRKSTSSATPKGKATPRTPAGRKRRKLVEDEAVVRTQSLQYDAYGST